MTSGLHWEELELAGSRALGDIRVYETEVSTSAGPVLLGLDADGMRHLLVPVPEAGPVRADTRSRGVHLEDRALIDGGLERRFCDVVCRVRHLNELFGVLADEMVAGIAAEPDDPMEVCAAVLDRWRELLERESTKLLGPKQISAVFAELWNLRRLISRDPDTLQFWVGPEGSVHDIRTPRGAIEVKAISARYGRIVEIHGQEQLRAPEGGDLHLSVIRVEAPAIDGGTTLPALIGELLDLGADRHDLLQKLSRVGYRTEDQDAYESVSVEVLEERIYRVDDTLPRIVPESFQEARVPPGVVRLVYAIDLTGEPPVPLTADGVEALVDALVSG